VNAQERIKALRLVGNAATRLLTVEDQYLDGAAMGPPMWVITIVKFDPKDGFKNPRGFEEHVQQLVAGCLSDKSDGMRRAAENIIDWCSRRLGEAIAENGFE
jgi:hypothetical protein